MKLKDIEQIKDVDGEPGFSQAPNAKNGANTAETKKNIAIRIATVTVCVLSTLAALLITCIVFSHVSSAPPKITTADSELTAGSWTDESVTESEPAVSESSDISCTVTETETETETEPPVLPPPPPVSISISPDDLLISMSEGDKKTIRLTLNPDGSDTSQISANVSDKNAASAEISVDSEGKASLIITAAAAGKSSVELFYASEPSVKISVTVKAKAPETTASPVETSPLPPVHQSSEIDPERPMLALTFDDGPAKHTNDLLDILKKYNAHATFFVIGYNIKGRESILQREIDEGHEIGIHTKNHYNLKKLSKEKVRDEIVSVRDRLKKITGVTPRLMRPPYGSFNDTVKAVCREEGLIIVNWSVDTLDWKTRDPGATYDSIIKSAKDGAIILCHDLHRETVAAMDKTIGELVNSGYQLVTVSELLSYSSRSFKAGDVVRKQ